MDKRVTPGERLSRFGAAGVLAVLSPFCLCLFAAALLGTADLSTGLGQGELIAFERDSLLLNLLLLALSLGLVYLFWRRCDRLPLKWLTVLLLGWTLLAGAAFICSAKIQQTQDAFVVSFWSMQAAKGDTSYYHGYFRHFPYQFGYALYGELFYRVLLAVWPGIPEGYAYLSLQGVNLLLLCLAELALIRIAGLLFSDERAQKLTALLLFLCPQGLLTCTYLYGNIPGLAFAVLALWAFFNFQREGRALSAVLCALCLSAAVVLKLNYMIVFIAVVLIWLLCLLRKPSLCSLLCLLLCVASVLCLKDLPQRWAERRMGESFGEGVSFWGWMAMGFNEGETCSGWYDPSYTVDLFDRCGGDRNVSGALAKEEVARRLNLFRQEPGEGLAFFGRKLLSVWNEPTYGSIWTNTVRDHLSPPGRLYTLLCVRGERTLKGWMNAGQQLVFFGLCAALCRLWRRRDCLLCLIPLIWLGGLLYHLLFEAKSQYALTCYLLLLPLAAWGLSLLFGLLGAKRER